MARMRLTVDSSASFEEVFKRFLLSKAAKGLAEKTLKTYQQHLSAIGKHLDTSIMIDDMTKKDLEEMTISMRESGLSANSIKSYTNTLKSFFSWCNEEGITDLTIPLYKAEETIKETYTDSELETLLKKPNLRNCKFSEYRNWVILNLLVNNGCRAATVRNIKIRDLDIDNRVIYLRHTKNKKAQVLPLCEYLCSIFKEYLRIRKGNGDDYLFPNEYGEQLTENGLRCSIARYNKRRGVEKTSLHCFRHTFAIQYLRNGGDIYTLKRLLGHKSLYMVQRYLQLSEVDMKRAHHKASPADNWL